MSENVQKSLVIPGLKYKDAPAAIEWLCRVFGFEKHAVYEGPNNTIAHAELTLGGGMIMLGSGTDTAHGRLLKHPNENDGFVTQGIYLVVADSDAVYARVKAAGTEIVRPIEEMPYGGREFSCRDLEGYLWSAGGYDPWTAK
jgi:uncharacterized glyoxalase superfamily protein PhnB